MAFLLGSLVIFSKVYRKRQAGESKLRKLAGTAAVQVQEPSVQAS